ncbi:MAG: hypothetical protein HY437_02195 [Candidatus Magasanikbacteria bacterium]|nr:hypothetical protein [Candidatus Magasanikbacteria bacterium]
MATTTITQLIDTSFVPAAHKKILHDHLTRYGDDDRFYTLFNTHLIEELQRRKTNYLEVMRMFDSTVGEITETLAQKKATLEKELEQKLAGVATFDVAKKAPIWEAYYQQLNALQKEFEKKMQTALASLMRRAIH